MKTLDKRLKWSDIPLALSGQLFISHLSAVGIGLLIFIWLTENAQIPRNIMLIICLGGLVGLILTLNIQRSLWVANWALNRLIRGLPIPDFTVQAHWPLTELMTQITCLSGQDIQTGQLKLHDDLSKQIEEAAAQVERNRLARELHDSIKQQLFSLQVSAASAQVRLGDAPETVKDLLDDIRQRTQEALTEMNVLLQELSPAPLEKSGLKEALQQQGEALGYRTGAQVRVRIKALPDHERLPLGAQDALFRIVQEAFSNIARHARASQVTLNLEEDTVAETLSLIIEDDGQGFEPEQEIQGRGLKNIQQRVSELGGKLTVQTEIGQGTRLQVAILLIEPLVTSGTEPDEVERGLAWVLRTGLGSGLLLTGLLAFLGYTGLVAFLEDTLVPDLNAWLWVQLQRLGLLSPIIAVIIGGSGYWAARKTRASSRARAILAGTLSGCLAGMTLFLGLGAATAGILGLGVVFDHGLMPAANEAEFRSLITLAVIDISWWTYGFLWVTLLLTSGFGALGGALAPISAEIASEEKPETRIGRQSMPRLVNLMVAALLSAGMAFFAAVLIPVLLNQTVVDMVARYGLTPRLAASGVANWPVATTGTFYLIALITILYYLWTARQTTEKKRLRQISTTSYMLALYAGGLSALVFWLLQSMGHVLAATISWISLGLGLLACFNGLATERKLKTLGGLPAILPNLLKILTPGERVFALGALIWLIYLVRPLGVEFYALIYLGGLLFFPSGVFIIGRRIRHRPGWPQISRSLQVYTVRIAYRERLLDLLIASTLVIALPILVGLVAYWVNLLQLPGLFGVLANYPGSPYVDDTVTSIMITDIFRSIYLNHIQVVLLALVTILGLSSLSLLVNLGMNTANRWLKQDDISSLKIEKK